MSCKHTAHCVTRPVDEKHAGSKTQSGVVDIMPVLQSVKAMCANDSLKQNPAALSCNFNAPSMTLCRPVWVIATGILRPGSYCCWESWPRQWDLPLIALAGHFWALQWQTCLTARARSALPCSAHHNCMRHNSRFRTCLAACKPSWAAFGHLSLRWCQSCTVRVHWHSICIAAWPLLHLLAERLAACRLGMQW